MPRTGTTNDGQKSAEGSLETTGCLDVRQMLGKPTREEAICSGPSAAASRRTGRSRALSDLLRPRFSLAINPRQGTGSFY